MSTFAFQTHGNSASVPNAIARVLLLVVGSALVCSAFGVWLVPGSSGMAALTLMKLGASLLLLISGMCCFAMGREARR